MLSLDAGAIAGSGPDAITLAEAEGLDAHARSIAARLNRRRLSGPPPQRHHPGRKKRGAAARRAIEQEREVAIYDLLEANLFKPKGSPGGPYRLALGVEGEPAGVRHRAAKTATRVGRILLSLTPFRRIVKDYFLVCDSYYKAIRTAPPSPDRIPRYGPPRACTMKAPSF